MKKAILLIVCMGTIFCSNAQKIPGETSKPTPTKEEYLKKSKKLWRAAIIMVSVGGAMTITGLALAIDQDDYNNNDDELAVGLILGGSALMLGSLGCSIPGHIYKKKALSVSFKNEQAPLLQRSMVYYKSVPSLSLKISL